jgi:V/A-type H+/Na+-transporting ATPase subunit E
LSEPFEKLQNRILSDARVKAEDQIREAEEKAAKTVESAKEQAGREADAVLAKARLDAEALRRSVLSSKIRANRLRLLEEKNRIVRSVVSAAEEKLSSIALDPAFMETLKKMVEEAVEAIGTDTAVVRVGFDGVKNKDFSSMSPVLPRGAKLVVEEAAIDELGGVVASDAKGKIVYNNSFQARMDRLDSQLLALISSTVFGE